MKVFRLAHHFRIHLTPTEYEALLGLVTRGEGDINALSLHEWQELSPGFRYGFKHITRRGAWAVNDRRKR